jgi:SOS-response transcriptional repressor LexA
VKKIFNNLKMTPYQRIQNELDRRNLRWQWVADGLGFEIQRVHNWKSRGVPAMHYRAVADLLGYTIDWIEGLEPTPNEARQEAAKYSPANVTPIDSKGKVPLVSWVAAGKWCEQYSSQPEGIAEKWLDYPLRHGPHTFALKVRGDSMFNPGGEYSFKDGDLIFVDPDKQAQHRSLIICHLDDAKEATFKRLLIEGEIKMLEALNPSWPERIIRGNGNATICGVIIGKLESY